MRRAGATVRKPLHHDWVRVRVLDVGVLLPVPLCTYFHRVFFPDWRSVREQELDGGVVGAGERGLVRLGEPGPLGQRSEAVCRVVSLVV